MTKTTKLTYQDFRLATDKVTESIGLGKSHHYAYVVGGYESLIAHIAADLPKAKQKEVMDALAGIAKRTAELSA